MAAKMKLSNGTVHTVGEQFAPEPIDVLAEALSYINRFTGHVGAYSVAQHCCYVSDVLPSELQLSGLLHDVHEAYIGDISSPVKSALGLRGRVLESFYLDMIDSYYDVTTRHDLVHAADIAVLVAEAKAFGLYDTDNWPAVPAANIMIERWSPSRAKREFLIRFSRYRMEAPKAWAR